MSQPSETEQTNSEPSKKPAVALDIETINLVPDPDLDFQDPTHWTVFCIPLGYRSPDGSIETDVLFRTGPTACDERELIDRTIEWIRSQNPTPKEIITYNGAAYDIPILKHRATVTTRECRGHHPTRSDMQLILDYLNHNDLAQTVKEQAGYNVKLESALDYHDIPTVETTLNGGEIDGSDMPTIGLDIIAGDASDREKQAVREYAESDVEPLFALDSAVHE